jgi:hypothetical protein
MAFSHGGISLKAITKFVNLPLLSLPFRRLRRRNGRERRVLRHCRLANEADSPTSVARGGLQANLWTVQLVVVLVMFEHNGLFFSIDGDD